MAIKCLECGAVYGANGIPVSCMSCGNMDIDRWERVGVKPDPEKKQKMKALIDHIERGNA